MFYDTVINIDKGNCLVLYIPPYYFGTHSNFIRLSSQLYFKTEKSVLLLWKYSKKKSIILSGYFKNLTDNHSFNQLLFLIRKIIDIIDVSDSDMLRNIWPQ